MLWNIGKSFSGPLPDLTTEQKDLLKRLRDHVTMLASDIGARSLTSAPQNLATAAAYIEHTFDRLGYTVSSEEVSVETFDSKNRTITTDNIQFDTLQQSSRNVIAEKTGASKASEIIVIGAHYDSIYDCPAANDNASGVAAMLELARLLSNYKTDRTLRFVAFTNEEPPFFRTPQMGSYVHAQGCRNRKENIAGMISLECIGYYTNARNSQKYRHPVLSMLYPSVGNFVAFISNLRSPGLLSACIRSFRNAVSFPSEAAAVPAQIPGVDFSDHWSFWQFGYQAIMVTDTANYRYPYYHDSADTPDKLDYDGLTRVVTGIKQVVLDLCGNG